MPRTPPSPFSKSKKRSAPLEGDWPAPADLEERLGDKDEALRIHRALHRLPDPYREVFWLRTFGELSFAQIAGLFEKTESWGQSDLSSGQNETKGGIGMNISCKVIQDLLPLYHDNVASPETNALVEEHLQTCPDCLEEYHKLQEASTLAAAIPSSKRDTKIMEGFKQVRRGLRKKWVKIAALAVAATLVVTMGLAFFANTYRIVPQAEEILQGVSVEDGLLTVHLETPFLLSPMTLFTPL